KPKESAYCMAKSAIDMFTKCMATELGPKGIRVNSVKRLVQGHSIPLFNLYWYEERGVSLNVGRDVDSLLQQYEGPIAPYPWDPNNTPNDLFVELAPKMPVKRVAISDDLAFAVLLLAAPESTFITGTNMLVDGGYTVAGL
ncbi:unnamed protein product, partial [Oppiella nova]